MSGQVMFTGVLMGPGSACCLPQTLETSATEHGVATDVLAVAPPGTDGLHVLSLISPACTLKLKLSGTGVGTSSGQGRTLAGCTLMIF